MSNEAKNLSKFLHFTDALCAFADKVGKNHDCQFDVEIDDDKFKFDLPELVAEIRKYRQAVIDDIENLSDDEQDNKPPTDDTKQIFGQPRVPEYKLERTNSDGINMSDFDYVRKDMPDNVKKVFDLVLPLSIIEEAKAYETATEPKPKEKRIKAVEMHAMLRLAQIAVS